jgi:DNA-binding PadR family transcriptional regulator
VQAGSLFPALHRLEREHVIEGNWTTSAEGRRVKSYTLTATGHRRLTSEQNEWERIVAAVSQVLRAV